MYHNPEETDDQQRHHHKRCGHANAHESQRVNLVNANAQQKEKITASDHNTDQSLPPRTRSETSPDSQQSCLTENDAHKCCD
jgi:hypothetical protein